MVTTELQVFPDVITNTGNVVRRSNKTLGDHVVIQRDGLKGIHHEVNAPVEVNVPEGGSPFDLIGQSVSSLGELKTIEVGSKWALRPGTRVDDMGNEIPRYIMTNGVRDWWVLIPADEAVEERARLGLE